MRARLSSLLVVLVATGGVALAGCAASAHSGTANNTGGDPMSTSDSRANGRTVCQAVRKTSDHYLASIFDVSGDRLASQTHDWAGSLSQDARDARDSSLQTALLGLADVVRGWGSRPPDKAAVVGFQNDMDVACQPYLSDSASAT